MSAETTEAEAEAETLVVFSTPTCAPCKAIKKLLDSDGIDYTPIDLTEDADALERIKSELKVALVQTPLFRWKGKYLTIASLPQVRDEAKAPA